MSRISLMSCIALCWGLFCASFPLNANDDDGPSSSPRHSRRLSQSHHKRSAAEQARHFERSNDLASGKGFKLKDVKDSVEATRALILEVDQAIFILPIDSNARHSFEDNISIIQEAFGKFLKSSGYDKAFNDFQEDYSLNWDPAAFVQINGSVNATAEKLSEDILALFEEKPKRGLRQRFKRFTRRPPPQQDNNALSAELTTMKKIAEKLKRTSSTEQYAKLFETFMLHAQAALKIKNAEGRDDAPATRNRQSKRHTSVATSPEERSTRAAPRKSNLKSKVSSFFRRKKRNSDEP